MKEFFEYFYYRIAKLNFKRDFERAIISVSLCQYFFIYNFYFLIIAGPLDLHGKTKPIEYIIILAAFFGLDYYNGKVYSGRFGEFDNKWKDESKKEKTIGMIKVMTTIILSAALFFVNAYIYNRFK